MLDATRLAKIKEMSLRSNAKTIGSVVESKKSAYVPKGTGSSQEQKGILGRPNYRF